MTDNTIKFEQVIEALLDKEHPFPAGFLRSFSDLSPKNLRELIQVWPQVNRERKVALFEDLESIAESDTLVSFDELAKMALTDPDPAVRVLSIRSLWECEDAKLVPIFSELMLGDPAEDVRAAAASALGKYVYLGELETIPEILRISNVQNLLDVVTGEDLLMVRRRALESLGFSNHTQVPELIQKAASTEDTQWLTSALYAMARSENAQWSEFILSQLNSPDSEVQFEAIRAAGELEIDEARDKLLERLEDAIDDPDLRYAIIWSLSQIGGDGVKQKFENLIEKAANEEEVEWLEKGLDNLELGGDLDRMEMLDVGSNKKSDEESDEESEESDEYLDLDEMDEEDFED